MQFFLATMSEERPKDILNLLGIRVIYFKGGIKTHHYFDFLTTDGKADAVLSLACIDRLIKKVGHNIAQSVCVGHFVHVCVL